MEIIIYVRVCYYSRDFLFTHNFCNNSNRAFHSVEPNAITMAVNI